MCRLGERVFVLVRCDWKLILKALVVVKLCRLMSAKPKTSSPKTGRWRTTISTTTSPNHTNVKSTDQNASSFPFFRDP